MNKKKKWIIAGVLALAAAFALMFGIISEARYRTEKSLELSAIRVILRTRYIDAPEGPADTFYDGLEHVASVYLPEGVTISGTDRATNAGTYEIRLSLTDPDTTAWLDGSTGDLIYTWSILPRPIPIPHLEDTVQIYSGALHAPTVVSLDGTYAAVSGTTESTAAGRYSVTFSLRDPVNTRWADGTTAAKTENWSLNVCRIGEILYPSVTEAFATERSASALPVELLCNWRENALNASGTDWFSLNGYTLGSEGVTVENRGTLTVLGNGTIRTDGTANTNHACVKNSGNLTVADGVFEASYTGNAPGGIEVYALWNTDGTATVSGGTYNVNGGTLAADGIYVSGGDVTISGGSFDVTTAALNHGAYLYWQDGGTLSMSGGTARCSASVPISAGVTTAGSATISGGTATVECSSEEAASLFQATGSGEVVLSGGTHTLRSPIGNALAAASGGTVTMSGGTVILEDSSESAALVNSGSAGLLARGGTAILTDGEIRIQKNRSATLTGAYALGGTLVIQGGSVEVESTASGVYAFGVVSNGGSASVSGLGLEITNPSGQVEGFSSNDNGTLVIQSGSFTLAGDVVTPGNGHSPGTPIETRANNTDAPFVLYYGSGWSSGSNWTNPPYIVSASPLSERRSARTANAGLRGLLAVENGILYLGCRETKENGLSPENRSWERETAVLPGLYEVVEERGEGVWRLSVERTDSPEEETVTVEELPFDASLCLLGTEASILNYAAARKSFFAEKQIPDAFLQEPPVRIGVVGFPGTEEGTIRLTLYYDGEGNVFRILWEKEMHLTNPESACIIKQPRTRGE